MGELKPCPFCGSDKVEITESKYEGVSEPQYYAYCPICGTTSSEYETRGAVIRVWKDRPLESALSARVAELEGALDKLATKSAVAMIKELDTDNARLRSLNAELKLDAERLAENHAAMIDGIFYCVHCGSDDVHIGVIKHEKDCIVELHRLLMARIEEK